MLNTRKTVKDHRLPHGESSPTMEPLNAENLPNRGGSRSGALSETGVAWRLLNRSPSDAFRAVPLPRRVP